MSIEKAVMLCDYYTSHADPKMKWMWGEGLFGYSLLELEEFLKENRYDGFLMSFADYWHEHKPKVHSSDTSAPGLITYGLWKKTGDDRYMKLTETVLDYMKNEPRVLEGLVNHMGHSGYDIWYPKSVWVDSLMMFGVFASVYGKGSGDEEFVRMAKETPLLLAKYLQDKKRGLWYHSYWVKLKNHYPMRPIFWGRGNSWVISAIPKILDNLGECEEADEMKKILQDTSKALLKYQHSDGSFSTLLGRVGVYKESAATALIAEGWMHAVRMGYLDKSYLEPAFKAYDWVESCIETRDGKVQMTRISGPTIPVHIVPWLGYALVPKGNNWTYGMAGYIFASIEREKLK